MSLEDFQSRVELLPVMETESKHQASDHSFNEVTNFHE